MAENKAISQKLSNTELMTIRNILRIEGKGAKSEKYREEIAEKVDQLIE